MSWLLCDGLNFTINVMVIVRWTWIHYKCHGYCVVVTDSLKMSWLMCGFLQIHCNSRLLCGGYYTVNVMVIVRWSRIHCECHGYLRNECLFFWVHGEWIVARDKQIAWTAKRFSVDLFVPRYDSFPMNQEKKTLIPYITMLPTKDPF